MRHWSGVSICGVLGALLIIVSASCGDSSTSDVTAREPAASETATDEAAGSSKPALICEKDLYVQTVFENDPEYRGGASTAEQSLAAVVNREMPAIRSSLLSEYSVEKSSGLRPVERSESAAVFEYRDESGNLKAVIRLGAGPGGWLAESFEACPSVQLQAEG